MPSPDPRSKPNGEYKETPFYGDFRDDLLEILRELNEMDKDKENSVIFLEQNYNSKKRSTFCILEMLHHLHLLLRVL